MAPVVIMLRIIFCADAGLHAGGAGDHFGADLGDDRDVGDLGKGRALIAGDGGGVGSAGSGVGGGGDNIGRAAGSGEADDDVFAGGAAAGDIALAQFFGVFVDFNGGGEGFGAAGHDVLHLPGSGGVGGGALGGVEGGDAAAGTGADIDEPAAVAQAARNVVDDLCNFGKGFLDSTGNLGVFVIDDAGYLQRRFGVKALGSFVLALGGQVLEEGSRVRLGFLFPVSAGAFVRRRTG